MNSLVAYGIQVSQATEDTVFLQNIQKQSETSSVIGNLRCAGEVCAIFAFILPTALSGANGFDLTTGLDAHVSILYVI